MYVHKTWNKLFQEQIIITPETPLGVLWSSPWPSHLQHQSLGLAIREGIKTVADLGRYLEDPDHPLYGINSIRGVGPKITECLTELYEVAYSDGSG